MPSRASLRSCGSLCLATTLALTGCSLSLTPLQKHTQAFASATSIVVSGATDAYREANDLHTQEQVSLAVINYDKTPGWNPENYAKPLLTDEQLIARTQLLNALRTYAETIADIASSKRDTDLSGAASDVASNLQSLSTTVTTAFGTDLPGATSISDTEKNALNTALVGLADFLRARVVKRKLPEVLSKNDPFIKQICQVLDSDIQILRRQSTKDYEQIEVAEDQYIRHTALSREEKRLEIEKLPNLVIRQRKNDLMLAQLQKSVRTLALTHHALAVAAQGNNPESVSQYIADLSAEGQALSQYYQSLSTSASTSK